MNRKLGIYSSIITLAAVAAFAASMIAGTDFGSYLSSMFIAWGFVPLICSLAAAGGRETRAAGYTAIAFAAVYAVFIAAVYFSQLTLKMPELTEQASALLDYSKFGLFFSYDLLGYAFMALATFFIGFTIGAHDRVGKWLKSMLMIHGLFAVMCVVMPMLGIFKPGMEGGDLIGVLVLEVWCAYFIPVCLLSYRYFRKAVPMSA